MAAKRRYGTLNRDAVARAGIELGFENLTLTGVAEHLGSSAAALYYHVKDRDDLVRITIDVVADELPPIGEIDDVGAFVHREGMALFDLFDRHPGLTDALRSLDGPPDSFGRRVADAHGALVEGGVDPHDAFLMLSVMYSHALETGRWLTSSGFRTVGESDLDARSAENPTDAYPSLLVSLLGTSPEKTYERMLTMLIDGVASIDPRS